MGRQIVLRQAAPAGGLAALPQGAAPQSDPYGDQIVKLIPVETVSLFVFLDGVISAATVNEKGSVSATVAPVLFIALVAACLVGTPLYLMRGASVAHRVQLVVSTAAFAVWAFATARSPAAFWGWWPPPIVGNVLVPLFTFAAPLFLPKQMP